MKTYFSDIIPKIQEFSQKLDDLTLLTNHHWVVIDDMNEVKNVYIFRSNNELLISQDGRVEKAKWEYLGHNSLLIDRKDESYLFKHGFFDENVLALKIDSKNEYAFLVNESRYDQELNSLENVVDFLNKTYLSPEAKKGINETYKLNQNADTDLGTKKPKENKYMAPAYDLKKIETKHPLLGKITEVYSINFNDGESGVIYIEQKNERAFFKGKISPHIVAARYYYNNYISCANALHYYLKFGLFLKKNFLFSL